VQPHSRLSAALPPLHPATARPPRKSRPNDRTTRSPSPHLYCSLHSSVLRSHIKECEEYATKAILKNAKHIDKWNRRDAVKRQRTVKERRWYLSRQVRQRMRSNDQRDLTHVDPSVLSLQTIPFIPQCIERMQPRARSTGNKSQRRSRYGGILLPKSKKEVPKYDAWIPVLVNYWVGKELHLEPYMRFFGRSGE